MPEPNKYSITFTTGMAKVCTNQTHDKQLQHPGSMEASMYLVCADSLVNHGRGRQVLYLGRLENVNHVIYAGLVRRRDAVISHSLYLSGINQDAILLYLNNSHPIAV